MTNTNFITVSFAKMFPCKLVDFTLNGDRTLRFLLEFAGVLQPDETINFEKSDVRVLGKQNLTNDTVLEDGDKIMIFGLIKGNADDFITVRVGHAPGNSPEAVVIPPFATVAQAMVAAEIEDGLYDLFVNDIRAEAGTQLRDGDLVIIKNSPVVIGPEIGDEYTEDYESFREEETPSQKLYAAAEDATRKAKLIRKVAQACDEDMGFLYLMAEVFRS